MDEVLSWRAWPVRFVDSKNESAPGQCRARGCSRSLSVHAVVRSPRRVGGLRGAVGRGVGAAAHQLASDFTSGKLPGVKVDVDVTRTDGGHQVVHGAPGQRAGE